MLLGLLPLSASARGGDSSPLFRAQSLKCVYGPGTATKWERGKPISKSTPGDGAATFDAIDLKKHAARVSGTFGAHKIGALASRAGITFVEWDTLGLAETTVFAVAEGKGRFPAMEIRHTRLENTAWAEQYPGTCEILQ